MMPPMVVLCGGLATRMRPATERIPKSLLDVDGEPFLGRQLRLLKAKGLERVVLSIGHLGSEIERFVGNGSHWGLEVRCCSDGNKLLGTGGAVQAALPLLGDEFWILYGDSYLNTDYARILESFRASGCPALMSVYRNEGRWDKSNVQFESGRVLRYDKKNPAPASAYIDYGLILMKASAWTHKAGAWDLAELLGLLAQTGKLAGFPVAERFYEIGSPAGLEDLRRYFRAEAALPAREKR